MEQREEDENVQGREGANLRSVVTRAGRRRLGWSCLFCLRPKVEGVEGVEWKYCASENKVGLCLWARTWI